MRTHEGYDPSTFNSLKVSPSRINALLQCGVAFEKKYLKGEPEEKSGSAALFGSVMHEALEKWAMNRKSSLLSNVRAAWLVVTEGTVVNDFLGAYGALSTQAIRMEHQIREEWAAKGKESKAPRMTKQWKDSAVAAKIGALQYAYFEKLNAHSPWTFTENDPLPGLYDESLVLAKRYEAKWSNLPNALYTELAFDVKWGPEEFLLNGYIDAIEPVYDKDGALEAILVTDYKTYRKEPAAAKDERQMVMYDIAIKTMIERGEMPELAGLPIFPCMDYVRLLDRKVVAVTQDGYDRLLKELQTYKTIVDARAFMPAEKNRNPDFCPYGDSCCLKTTTCEPMDVAWPGVKGDDDEEV
jgi:hypothetical protein